jgi:hypothetical protein
MHATLVQVRDLLETGGGSAELEEHLASCNACAELLRREARVEEKLFEVARAPVRPARRLLWGTAIALAASAVLCIGTALANTRPPSEANAHRVHPTTLAVLDGQAATLDGGVGTN